LKLTLAAMTILKTARRNMGLAFSSILGGDDVIDDALHRRQTRAAPPTKLTLSMLGGFWRPMSLFDTATRGLTACMDNTRNRCAAACRPTIDDGR